MTFTTAFSPAVNAQGYSKVTFLGLELKSGSNPKKDKEGKDIIDPDTGEVAIREWVMRKLNFEVMGRVKGTSQTVAVTVGDKYDEENVLGQTLKAMGFKLAELSTVTDEDGFDVEVVPEDEDGFGSQADDIGADIETFLTDVMGAVYIAKVAKLTEGKQKGFWGIDHKTIKHLVKK